jgi:hypothetical protein
MRDGNDRGVLAQERAMTRKEVLKKGLSGELTWIQVAEILRLTPRQVRRIRKRYEQGGEQALLDLRLGRKSARALSDEWQARILTLYRERYRDFSALHFYEKLTGEHGIRAASYTRVLQLLQAHGLLEKHARRSAHRKRRERRPMSGMLLHLDGSTHAWLGPEHPNLDLLVVMDDATSQVYSARFVPQESTLTCMRVLRETIEKMGVFCSLYVDRAMHFVITTKAGQKPDRARKSQIERALDRLGIELICAYSPQARGRSERLWRTWQGRLPQELRLAGIRTIEEANAFLAEKFVPWHNGALTVEAREPAESAFVPCPATLDLDLLFSVQARRQVNSDNTVQYKTRTLQIEAKPALRYSFAGLSVTVHEHEDGTFSISHGPHRLGRYDAQGQPLAEPLPLKSEPCEPIREPEAQKVA